MDQRAPLALRRELGPWQAASLVVGTVIGTGVFLKTSVMVKEGHSPAWVLAAWAVAGALSLAGALTYAELGAMFPDAGGEYVFLREGWGRFTGFLYGWTRFWIGTPGSIAAYAVGASTFLGGVVLPFERGSPAVAIAFVAVFTAINCANVGAGGRLQAVLTFAKVALIAVIAIGGLVAPRGAWSHFGEGGALPGASAFGVMVLAAAWAFDGWNNLPMAAGEVRDPSRNLPRALVGGSFAVLAIYAVVNVAYFHALTPGEIATSASAVKDAPPVAAKVAEQFLGGATQVAIACAMALSALSAMNGSMLTGARVPFAAAADGLAPRVLARVSARARVPVVSVIVQGAWASVLAASGSFDELTDAVVFVSWLFYALNAGTVIILRRRTPDRTRPFRVPGYPIVPLVFVAAVALLVANTLVEKPKESVFGLAFVAAGAVVYGLFLRKRR